MAGPDDPPAEPGQRADRPHYIGHRSRLRARFHQGGDEGMSDYELLELVLFRSMPRCDTKPVAKALIGRFGTFAEVLGARIERLKEIDGIGDAAAGDLKIIEAAARRMARGAIKQRPVLDHWRNVIDYCRTAMAFADREEFRILFLDRRNCLIADEIQGSGTVDHAPAYPREIIRRALEVGATAVILVHNHPSGDPSPSTADVHMTLEIANAAKPLGIELLDHIIVGRHGHASFKGLRLI